MMSDSAIPEARDLGQAILLLQILGGNVQSLTAEIRHLRDEMATREELYEVRDALNKRMDSLTAQVQGSSTSSRLKKASEVAQQLGILFAIGASVVGGLFALVHFWDALPK
jgi:hypothetical protein